MRQVQGEVQENADLVVWEEASALYPGGCLSINPDMLVFELLIPTDIPVKSKVHRLHYF